jgi:hypothetical protein
MHVHWKNFYSVKSSTTEDTESHRGFFTPCSPVLSVVKTLNWTMQESQDLEVISQFREAAYDEQFLGRRSRVDLLVLQYPRVAMRHEDGMQPGS